MQERVTLSATQFQVVEQGREVFTSTHAISHLVQWTRSHGITTTALHLAHQTLRAQPEDRFLFLCTTAWEARRVEQQFEDPVSRERIRFRVAESTGHDLSDEWETLILSTQRSVDEASVVVLEHARMRNIPLYHICSRYGRECNDTWNRDNHEIAGNYTEQTEIIVLKSDWANVRNTNLETLYGTKDMVKV